MSFGLFSTRPLIIQPHGPSITQASLRRTFSSARDGNPFAGNSSARAAIWGFIGLNAAVFGAWQYAAAKQDRGMLRWMSNNFVLTLQNCREGRYHTMITSALSHHNLGHFAFNMITFFAFGNILTLVGVTGPAIGSLCLGSAIAGSAAFYIQQAGNSMSRVGALGASGVVMGMGAAATCLMPFAPMQLMFIPINFPLWVFTAAYVGLDTYYLHDASSRTGHSAHLGGSAFGALFYVLFLRRYGGIANMVRGGLRR